MSKELKKETHEILENDGHKVLLHIQECQSPKDYIYISFTTTFDRSIYPDHHDYKFSITLKNRNELKNLSNLLASF